MDTITTILLNIATAKPNTPKDRALGDAAAEALTRTTQANTPRLWKHEEHFISSKPLPTRRPFWIVNGDDEAEAEIPEKTDNVSVTNPVPKIWELLIDSEPDYTKAQADSPIGSGHRTPNNKSSMDYAAVNDKALARLVKALKPQGGIAYADGDSNAVMLPAHEQCQRPVKTVEKKKVTFSLDCNLPKSPRKRDTLLFRGRRTRARNIPRIYRNEPYRVRPSERELLGRETAQTELAEARRNPYDEPPPCPSYKTGLLFDAQDQLVRDNLDLAMAYCGNLMALDKLRNLFKDKMVIEDLISRGKVDRLTPHEMRQVKVLCGISEEVWAELANWKLFL